MKLGEAVNVSPASFIISGAPGTEISIVIPQGKYVLTNGEKNLEISQFQSDLNKSVKINGKGFMEINIGATLEIKPGQASGHYSNLSPLEVTVAYN